MSLQRETITLKEGTPKIRVMQWNLLARGLSRAEEGIFPCTDSNHLQWSHRFSLIVEELSRYSADIISVEELDQKNDLMASLEPLGYQCLYAPNANSPCLHLKTPSPFGPDGVGIIYKTETIDVVSHDIVQIPMAEGKPQTKPVLSAVLRLKQHDNTLIRFIVVHLKSKKAFANVRLTQFLTLVNYLAEVSKNDELPTIISGDFNAEPHEPAIAKCVECAFHSVMPTAGPDIYSTAKFQSDQQDRSKTLRHVRLIDYIFYRNTSKHCLQPLTYLKMPNLSELEPNLLPAANYPSDHVSLVVDFDVLSEML